MKRQTSGCMRHVCERNRPRSGGTVSLAEQVLEHRRLAPAGWTPCETWPSCCGSPRSTMFRAHVPARARRPVSTWPASSTNSVSMRRPCPLARRATPVPPAAARRLPAREQGLVAQLSRTGPRTVAFLQAAEREALLARRALDLLDQVIDRLVALRGPPDSPAELHQATISLAAVYVLPGTRRALDHQVRAGRARARRVLRRGRLSCTRDRERLADEDRLEARRLVSRQHHRPAPEGRLLTSGRIGPPGIIAAGIGTSRRGPRRSQSSPPPRSAPRSGPLTGPSPD